MNPSHVAPNALRAFPRRGCAARGVTLIEVLISLLILSLALIGIAGLQAVTTSYQQGVFTRSSLSTHLNDITGRIRANLSEAPGFNPLVDPADSPYAFTDSWDDQQDEPDAPGTLCGIEASAVACTSAQRAAYDLWAWRSQVRDAMPQGSAQIAGSIHTGVTVTFMWFDKDNTDVEGLKEPQECLPEFADLSGNTLGEATLKRQTCCPEAASAPAGVRCANFTVVP